MTKKILITGGSGLLGCTISKLAARKFDVYATYNRNKIEMDNVSFFKADLTKRDDADKIKDIRPDIVVHCAAMTNVDYCEGHADEARSHNVDASVYVAEAAKACGAYLVHISTDSVFDGEKGGYSEIDEPRPINTYGKTKLEAERQVAALCPGSCIVRTNFYGWARGEKLSLAEWMINKLKNGEELQGLEDIYFSPILVNDLVGILLDLQLNGYKGIINIAGSETCSKLEFARRIARIFGFDSGLIKPVSIKNIGLKAPRGKDTSLNVSKAAGFIKKRLPGIDEGLKEMKTLYDKGYVKELRHG